MNLFREAAGVLEGNFAPYVAGKRPSGKFGLAEALYRALGMGVDSTILAFYEWEDLHARLRRTWKVLDEDVTRHLCHPASAESWAGAPERTEGEVVDLLVRASEACEMSAPTELTLRAWCSSSPAAATTRRRRHVFAGAVARQWKAESTLRGVIEALNMSDLAVALDLAVLGRLDCLDDRRSSVTPVERSATDAIRAHWARVERLSLEDSDALVCAVRAGAYLSILADRFPDMTTEEVASLEEGARALA